MMSAQKEESSLPDVDDIHEVFDLFDFWDGRDGLIDAVKVGDLLRCCGMNPTIDLIEKHGGRMTSGEKQYTFEEFLSIAKEISKEKDTGTLADFMEAFKSYDREGQGFISAAEVRQLLTTMGEVLTDREVDEIMKDTDIPVDLKGHLVYKDFIEKVMHGPAKRNYHP